MSWVLDALGQPGLCGDRWYNEKQCSRLFIVRYFFSSHHDGCTISIKKAHEPPTDLALHVGSPGTTCETNLSESRTFYEPLFIVEFKLTFEKVLAALEPSVVIAAMQTTIISASITAYSTAVGPSSCAIKFTTERISRVHMANLLPPDLIVGQWFLMKPYKPLGFIRSTRFMTRSANETRSNPNHRMFQTSEFQKVKAQIRPL